MGVSGQRHAPAALPGKGSPVPIVQEPVWAPVGLDTEARGKILSPLPGIKPRSLGRPARSHPDTILTELPRLLPVMAV
jgi:hypothetical protein